MAGSHESFEGPLGDTGYWHLRQSGDHWTEGYSLGPYTDGPLHRRTPLGERIHRFKYWNLDANQRYQIVEELSKRLLDVLWEVLGQKPPFTVCLAVPGNRGGPSLPHDICALLSSRYDWLSDASNAVSSTRSVGTVKPVPKSLRARYLAHAWFIDHHLLPFATVQEGILVIDDVYDTGATLREVSLTLGRAFPHLSRRYMVALSHVVTRDWGLL